MTDSGILIFLVLIQVKHYVADFRWQTGDMLANKGEFLHPAGMAHAGLHGLLSLPVMVLAGLGGLGLIVVLALAEVFVHHVIDWKKANLQKVKTDLGEAGFWRLVGLDQAAHQLTYVAILAIGLL
ncbi:DUF3307 domain-containing protein [Roseovarius aestuariivivens]|uniref:DUF3307 domain-containing protein n=1 Tax=Roseovarius aestuariivivens TaxID=1888910 RepID=UPI0010814D8A|nr:DUF3307 domain-containing protein [Roseovarius aestuariivivens]